MREERGGNGKNVLRGTPFLGWSLRLKASARMARLQLPAPRCGSPPPCGRGGAEEKSFLVPSLGRPDEAATALPAQANTAPPGRPRAVLSSSSLGRSDTRRLLQAGGTSQERPLLSARCYLRRIQKSPRVPVGRRVPGRRTESSAGSCEQTRCGELRLGASSPVAAGESRGCGLGSGCRGCRLRLSAANSV